MFGSRAINRERPLHYDAPDPLVGSRKWMCKIAPDLQDRRGVYNICKIGEVPTTSPRSARGKECAGWGGRLAGVRLRPPMPCLAGAADTSADPKAF